VHVLSIYEDRRRGLELGAASYLRKVEGREVLETVFSRVEDSIAPRPREVLVVNANEAARAAIADVLDIDNVRATYPPSIAEALDEARANPYDCVVVSAGAGDVPVSDALADLQKAAGGDLTVLVCAPEDGPDPAPLALRECTVVRKVHSSDRLLAEVTRILHIPETGLPEYKRVKLEKLRQVDDELTGCRVLIVDDDVRNIFALTSILERHQIDVLHAENGRKGIDTLLQNPDIDVVLMDIMMPEMDGYETIRAVRELEALRNLPIIAVTAKAMKGDREKCIDSGASDYIAKPVDLDQLFSLMRVWVHDRRQKAAGARTAV
jgi:CheY-like chemotaxis protein